MGSQVEKSRTFEIKDGSQIQIQRVEQEDLDTVWGIVNKCSTWLVNKGFTHWISYYTRELIEKKIKSQEVYLAMVDGKAVGTVTMDKNPVSYYSDEEVNSFTHPEKEAVYMTALAVDPEWQSKGIASGLVDFVEDEARNRHMEWIRFDCKAGYVELVEFYKKRGYTIASTILDKDDNNEPYYLMEKRMTGVVITN